MAAVLVGLPWLLVIVSGSPIPDRLPVWDEILSALSRQDDGTLLLAAVKYLTWVCWAVWVLLVLIEAVAQLSGRVAPRIPGLAGPQQAAALLVTSLGAALLGTSMSMSRAVALPTPPAGLAASAAPPHAAESTAAPAVPDQVSTRKPSGPANAYAGPAGLLRPTRNDTGHADDTGAGAVRADEPVQRTVTVLFGFDSAELSSAAEAPLAQAVKDIRHRADPTRPVILAGHTDSVGPAAYNQRLSVQRADTVRRALDHALGEGYRFQVIGKGEIDPIADETRPDGSDDPAGRALNRCVQITYTLQQPTGSATPPSSRVPSKPAAPPGHDQPPVTATPSPSPHPSDASPPAGAGAPTAPPATSQPTAPPASTPSGEHQPAPPAVRLPTGALVSLGLAAAIGIAVAATRLHRRRRRTLDPGHLAISEPEPTSPPAVRTLRKAHLDTYTATGRPVPTDSELVAADLTAKPPTHLAVGVRDGQSVTVALSGLNMGLIGPGAADVARAIATELLAGAHRSRVELLIPKHLATTVFGLTGDALTQFAEAVPELALTSDTGAALRHLETEVLHRARMMTDHDVPDVPALRGADPAEPLPTIVLIAETGEPDRFTHALQATLQLAERYGIAGLLLGPWPTGTTCRIDAGGHVLHTDGPNADTWSGTQLFHLPVTDTAHLLQAIRTARGTEEPSLTEPAEPAVPARDRPAPPAALQQPPPAGEDQNRPVRLRLFGPVRVETPDGQITTGLRRISRDLLAFLALHADGATREQAIDSILPDRDLENGSTMFHTAVNNTRQTLRKATGLREPMFVTYVGGRYRLDANLIDVDLWCFVHALNAAAGTRSDRNGVSALRQLANLYTGELAEDLTHEWAELERERIRRTGTDALVRLARLLQDDHPEEALAALERAFEHDPISEPLACDLMRLQAHLGRLDAVRRTHQLLAHRLNDLDIDASPETDRLLADLLRHHLQP